MECAVDHETVGRDHPNRKRARELNERRVQMSANEKQGAAKTGRRKFLQAAAASLVGATAIEQARAQQRGPIGGATREQLRQDMLNGIEDDLKKDLQMRAGATEELPEPKNIKPGAMLDARFPAYY